MVYYFWEHHILAVSLVKQYNYMLIPNQNDRLLVSHLLKEIQDQSLQNILRKVFLGNRTDIFEVIQEERPETKLTTPFN